MRFLFVHQNFPGQFKHLAPALAAVAGNEVVALSMHPQPALPGVRVVHYRPTRGSARDIHSWVSDFETKVIRAEAVYHACRQLDHEGFVPDVVIAHSGWGEVLFIKHVWPSARLGVYAEFFYGSEGSDSNFDPEFDAPDPTNACRLQLKNVNNRLHFDLADAAIAPTLWQASTFPEPFRSRISVIHDGIDTDAIAPAPNVSLRINQQIRLSRADQIITFVNRNLEPYRGYHVFMRALPELLSRHPQARVVIVGGDGVSYGAPPPGQSWKHVFLDEVKDRLDLSRVHFVGQLPYNLFIGLLQLSTVHVYLTYPFVLSWSLLEAMSVGCAIVASDTRPLHEVIQHGDTGRLVPFFDGHTLVREVSDLLKNPSERTRLGANARAFTREHYDLKRVCLPKQLAWVDALTRHN